MEYYLTIKERISHTGCNMDELRNMRLREKNLGTEKPEFTHGMIQGMIPLKELPRAGESTEKCCLGLWG